MAGYTRQDTTDNIATGKVINASDFDNEYNAIETAFNASSGHKHDGTSAEGARITVIGNAGQVSTDGTTIFSTSTGVVGLGKTNFVFKDMHVDNIVIDGNTITTITSGNLIVDPYTYKLEVRGGTAGGNTSGMIQLNCENISHGQSIQARPHGVGVTNKMLLPTGADSTIVSLVSADTLENKTLTTATLTTSVFSGVSTTASGNLQVKPATNILEVQGDGTGGPTGVAGQIQLNCHVNSHGQIIEAQPHSTGTTNKMLLPQGADSTLVSRVSVDTLENKTLTTPTISSISNTGTLTLPTSTDTLVGRDTTDTLTNKTITTLVNGGAITIPTGTDTLVGRATSDTLTNKTFDANFSASGNTLSNVAVSHLAGSALVTESEGIGSNDNDTSLPTSAAVKDYVDTQVGSISADIEGVTASTGLTGGGTSGTVALAIDTSVTADLSSSQTLTNKHLGVTTEEYLSAGNMGSSKTLYLDDDVIIEGTLDQTSCTITFNKTYAGGSQMYGWTILLKQGSGGNKTVTWPAGIKWADGGNAPTLSTVADRYDVFSFIALSSGTIWGFHSGTDQY